MKKRNHLSRGFFVSALAAAFLATAWQAPVLAALEDGKEEATFQELTPTKIYASSTLYEEGYDHSVWNLLDFDTTTDWAEGASGFGYGEYLEFTFPMNTVLKAVNCAPGFLKTENLFFRNGAPSRLTFACGDMSTELDYSAYTTVYEPMDWAYLELKTPLLVTGPVRVTISDVREGSYYEDTCISELHFWGYAGKEPEEAELSTYQMRELSSLASHLYRFHTKEQLLPMSLGPQNMTEEDYAFGLYWYQYNMLDDRISYDGDGENVARMSDLYQIVSELFMGGMEDAFSLFQEEYVLWQDGSGFAHMNGTGDFGDAGSFVFDDVYSDGMEGDRLCLKGSIKEYSPYTGDYEYSKNFRAYFYPNKSQTMYGWRFAELVVE